MLGALLEIFAFLAPVVAAVATAVVVSHRLPAVSTGPTRILWWLAVAATATSVLIITEWVMRRLTPLVALLKMSLVFPGLPPSRVDMARRAASTRDLERAAEAARHDAPPADVAQAAAQILILAKALSAHDRRTRGHSERVRVFTDLIADQLEIPAEGRDRLRWAALLHDVGKITVDPSILNKGGRPTEAQWAVLRTHPSEGARLTQPLREWLGEWGLAIEQHHEAYDGTGYPRGLVGTDIALSARIVAVADAFEVITARRSYKDALSPRRAQAELVKCSGTQFDPLVIRALLNTSAWRLRWAIGPASWLAMVPFVGSQATGALGAVATTAAGAATLSAGSILGWTTFEPSSPSPAPSVQPEPATSGAQAQPGQPKFAQIAGLPVHDPSRGSNEERGPLETVPGDLVEEPGDPHETVPGDLLEEPGDQLGDPLETVPGDQLGDPLETVPGDLLEEPVDLLEDQLVDDQ